jgi:hypothetical protein
MAYSATKPDAGDTISSSQSVLKDNFTAIKALVDVNHVTFGLSDQGKHNIVTIPQITVTPGSIPVAVASTEFAFYTATPSGGVPGLFLRTNQATAGTVTGDINLTLAGKTDPGWCRLPSGILMKWGSANTTNAGSQSITYTVGATIPVFAHVYAVQLAPVNTDKDTMVWLVSYGSTTTFDVISTDVRTGGHNKAAALTYLAIGD